jgi:hypothetical protein
VWLAGSTRSDSRGSGKREVGAAKACGIFLVLAALQER